MLAHARVVGPRATPHLTPFIRVVGFFHTTHARVVRDGNIITGGGVTAGIDFALAVLEEVAGAEVAQAVQLGLEYAPEPPFNSGRPETAPPEILARVQ